MRKTILSLIAATTLGTGLFMVQAATATPANAASASNYNCVNDSEKSHLRTGMSPGAVRRATGASPWLAVNDEFNGQPVRVEAFTACAPHADKAFAAMYRIDGNGGKHLMFSRYIVL